MHIDQILYFSNESRRDSEAWLFKNKEALASVQQGLKEAAAGKVRSLGSFVN